MAMSNTTKIAIAVSVLVVVGIGYKMYAKNKKGKMGDWVNSGKWSSGTTGTKRMSGPYTLKTAEEYAVAHEYDTFVLSETDGSAYFGGTGIKGDHLPDNGIQQVYKLKHTDLE
jgi:hypothetical protein